jgi:hypothetical protein
MPVRVKTKIDIDVVPYLSIMVIVLKLICLILIVTVMRVALNPRQLKVLSFQGQYQGADANPLKARTHKSVVKLPNYIECAPNTVSIFPGSDTLTLSQLVEPSNAVQQLLDRVQTNAGNEYIIILMRPGSVPVYRHLRKLLAKRDIDVGYDVLDAGSKIDWQREAKALNIQLPKE